MHTCLDRWGSGVDVAPGTKCLCGARERVARALTGGVQEPALGPLWGPGAKPLVGVQGGSLRKLSGFSIFECLWRALRYLIILKQMNYF